MDFKLKPFSCVINVTRLANIHYFEFTKNYHTFKDRHAFHEIVYVDSGFIISESENYTGRINEGQLLIHKADEAHSLTCPDDEISNVIIIGFECSSDSLDIFSYSPFTLSNTQKRLLTEIIKEGRTVFLPPYDVPNQKDMKKRENYPFGADQMIKLKLENLLIELIRSSLSFSGIDNKEINDNKIQEIREYLNDNFRNNVNLDELCFLFNTNKTSLCNNFRSMTGETIISYINKLKIKEAKKLLRSGSYNLTQIASIVGFSSIHYFSRTFKHYENQSPTSYIKTIKSRLML